LSVPQAGEQPVPGVPWVRVQLAPWLLESLPTAAVKGVAFSCAVALTGIIALCGKSETVIARTVIAAEFDLETSETEVATMARVRSLWTGLVGAV